MIRYGERVEGVVGEASRFEARGHPLRSQRAAAGGQRRIGLDKLLVELAEARLGGSRRRRCRRSVNY
jgi:hypothetical protein